MTRLLRQIRAIVRANQAQRGPDVVFDDALVLLRAVVIAVGLLNLLAFAMVLGAGR